MNASTAHLPDLRTRLPELMARDRRRLARRLNGLRKSPEAARRAAVIAEITADVEAAERRVARRRSRLPAIDYPPDLPISAQKDAVAAAIRDHQVVVVAGETGSGKSTQLPKICLELGRGVHGMIGHTQPRRLAARTVAARIAEELATPLGDAVGYQVRFTERLSEDTLVKLMTDGILLTEIQRDRLLDAYDTLIIDEAHERSLNIDFILGYVKRLLPRRPDLKVIITSATIDPARFSRHFDGAPVVEVSGRTYPVEVRYRPFGVAATDGPDDRDQVQAVCDAVAELAADGPGDILVFLSGEREIRDTADALTRLRMPRTEILPLYARLSAAEQHRVFQPHPGRRVVLATNVAETSLTVPGVRYVVDAGTARVSRYSRRTKVQRLPIEPISQASADQRKGRCGRLGPGICVRLYSEADFAARPAFTDPEILRTDLAAVILRMAALGLGDVAAFPFVDPPDQRNIKDGVRLLEELGALTPGSGDIGRRLTPLGRTLSQLPIDPRLGRMIIEAGCAGCLDEVLVIVAALAIQDPRERPADARQAADERHRRFAEAESDFLAYLNLWRYLQQRQEELSSSQFRKLCKAEFLNYLRVREWQDVYGQLRQITRSLGMTTGGPPADSARIHRALLAGLLSHIGLWDPEKSEYLGARGARFAISPGSALFKKPPRWVMAAELVETSRLWGHVVARIEPDWVEPLAGHLVTRSYSEPRWDRARGAVVAAERVSLYGVPIVVGRTVDYGRIDPKTSRELFIRRALVEGDWQTRHRFFHDNRRRLAEAEELEHRARRRDIVVDEETLVDFYDRRVGEEVVSARHFDTWWKRTRAERPDLLTFPRSLLVNDTAREIDPRDYPDVWRQGGLRLPLTYRFAPGEPDDGVSVTIPLAVLNQVSEAGFDWQVPGRREELATELIRSLPKPLRRHFVPAPDHARAALARLRPYTQPLTAALARELHRMSGVEIPPGSWRLDRLPDHLRVTFCVVDDAGRVLGRSKDLAELKERLAARVRGELAAAAAELTRDGLRSWDIGALPRVVETEAAGRPVRAYPALVDMGDHVAVRVFGAEAEQRAAHWRGARRLLLLSVAPPVKAVGQRLTTTAKLALGHNPYGSVPKLLDDCLIAAADKLMADGGGPPWDEAAFARLRDTVRAGLAETTADIVARVADILAVWHEVERRMTELASPALEESLDDIRRQLAGLVGPGFVSATGWARLPDLARYLRAVRWRLDKLPDDPVRDRERMRKIAEVERAYLNALARLPRGRGGEQAREIRWMIEELRVSYFAQTLGTRQPVSDKRILRALDALAA